MKNKIFISFLILILFIPFSASSNQKIAFIDLNYILNNSVAGKKLNNQIKEKTNKINKDFSNFKKK